ncbi:MAG: 30S ribosomal protein S8 [Acholeplasmatales bacterium]|jgi:small subunit ribosomal protein S8|nr:30S ribosomal protein S8 [Acholeplasmatales bacterium]
MSLSDPIADLLTRIRNANKVRIHTVDIPYSKIKLSILDVILKEGFIQKYDVVKEKDSKFSKIVVTLKYTTTNERVIQGLKRISKPGLRVYASAEQLPRVLNGLGVALISTSKGILTDAEARAKSIGGEVLAYLW